MQKNLILGLGLSALLVGGLGAQEKGAEPEATKLLADARAARAVWTNFPGFRAALEVSMDGKISQGKFNVDADGKVAIEGLEGDAKAWAKRTLASIVSHRLDSASSTKNTPCAFSDANHDHPLGKGIKVLNDELHSSYRIRDHQITEVNRVMGERRFTISVLNSILTKEKKFLSAAFVINFWDLKSGELVMSEGNHQEWLRVGSFDLPTTTLVVTTRKAEGSEKGSVSNRLTLSGHQLTPAAKSATGN